jgi:hypothetical protein
MADFSLNQYMVPLGRAKDRLYQIRCRQRGIRWRLSLRCKKPRNSRSLGFRGLQDRKFTIGF